MDTKTQRHGGSDVSRSSTRFHAFHTPPRLCASAPLRLWDLCASAPLGPLRLCASESERPFYKTSVALTAAGNALGFGSA